MSSKKQKKNSLDVTSLQQHLVRINQKYEDSEKELHQRNLQLNKTIKTLKKQTIICKKFHEQLVKLKKQNTKSSSEQKELKEDLRKEQNNSVVLQEQNSKLIIQIGQLKKQQKMLSSQLEISMNKSVEKIFRLEQDLLDSHQKENTTIKENEKQEKEKEIEKEIEKEQEKEQLKKQILDLQNELSKLKTEKIGNGFLEGNYENKIKIQKQELEIRKLKNTIKKNSLTNEGLEEQILEIEQKLDSKKKKNVGFKKELTEIEIANKKLLATINKQRQKIMKLKENKKKTLENTNSDDINIENDNNNSNGEGNGGDRINMIENKTLSKTNGEFEKKIKLQKDQLKIYRNYQITLKEKIEELETEKINFQKQIKQLSQINDDESNENLDDEEGNKQSQPRKNEFININRNIQESQEKINILNDQIEKMMCERKELIEKNAQLQDIINNKDKRESQLNQELEIAQESYLEVSNKMDNFQLEKNKLVKKLQKSKNENLELANKNSTLILIKDELQVDNKKNEQETIELEIEKDELKETIKKLELIINENKKNKIKNNKKLKPLITKNKSIILNGERSLENFLNLEYHMKIEYLVNKLILFDQKLQNIQHDFSQQNNKLIELQTKKLFEQTENKNEKKNSEKRDDDLNNDSVLNNLNNKKTSDPLEIVILKLKKENIKLKMIIKNYNSKKRNIFLQNKHNANVNGNGNDSLKIKHKSFQNTSQNLQEINSNYFKNVEKNEKYKDKIVELEKNITLSTHSYISQIQELKDHIERKEFILESTQKQNKKYLINIEELESKFSNEIEQLKEIIEDLKNNYSKKSKKKFSRSKKINILLEQTDYLQMKLNHEQQNSLIRQKESDYNSLSKMLNNKIQEINQIKKKMKNSKSNEKSLLEQIQNLDNRNKELINEKNSISKLLKDLIKKK
ncbi:hypothetical protein M0812_05305 [Anaeramoeba flamelloides]|uniref:Uncharacterized protein n=1 Tax=Anaeramoeba flamelloides TaxID=1746091 RepID=A0AAV8A8R0_9EUKA|nr:hypothetical protein M0812_05305 [Anaeramoeba flamelloides]